MAFVLSTFLIVMAALYTQRSFTSLPNAKEEEQFQVKNKKITVILQEWPHFSNKLYFQLLSCEKIIQMELLMNIIIGTCFQF